MIGSTAGNDLLLLRSSKDVLIVPGELDVRVVRIGAGDPELSLVPEPESLCLR